MGWAKDAAVGTAVAAEGAEDAVGVDRRQVQVAPRTRVAHAEVPVEVAPAGQEVAVDGGGHPLRAGLAAQPAPGARVAERPAVQVPGVVAHAGAHGVRLPVTGVGAGERLPARMVGRRNRVTTRSPRAVAAGSVAVSCPHEGNGERRGQEASRMACRAARMSRTSCSTSRSSMNGERMKLFRPTIGSP